MIRQISIKTKFGLISAFEEKSPKLPNLVLIEICPLIFYINISKNKKINYINK